MKRIAMISALGLACAGLLAGCVAPPPPVEDAHHHQHADGGPQHARGGSISSKVEELGQMDNLRVTDMRAVKRDGLLRVQITVSNSSSSNEQLYYRFRWLDADGFSVWEEAPWKPELIYGKQDKVINVTAPTFKAADFKLEVQAPNNSTGSSAPGNTGDNPPYR